VRHLDLFSGIGGFALSARWMNWETVQFVEIDKFCQKVLSKNFPNIPIHGDIKTFNGESLRGSVDILTGGFPCQPYSQSGKRLGTDDDRHLWPEMLRIIREVQPMYIVGENVRGITNWNEGVVFDEVQADLETEGYEVTPFLLPASAVNAQHRRDRVWFIAHSDGVRLERSIQFNGQPGKANEEPSIKINTPHVIEQLQLFRSDRGLRKNDGVSNWVDRIRGLGNAVVPQVVFEIYKAIELTIKANQSERH